MLSTVQIRQVPLANYAPGGNSQLSGWRPSYAARPMQPRRMGQNLSPGVVATFGVLPLFLTAAVAAGGAWVGLSTGAREKGLLSGLGYVLGSVAALSAVSATLTGILILAGIGISLLPGEEPQTISPNEQFEV